MMMSSRLLFLSSLCHVSLLLKHGREGDSCLMLVFLTAAQYVLDDSVCMYSLSQ